MLLPASTDLNRLRAGACIVNNFHIGCPRPSRMGSERYGNGAGSPRRHRWCAVIGLGKVSDVETGNADTGNIERDLLPVG